MTDLKKPQIGSTWVHKSGNEYAVVMLTNEYSERPEYPVTVVYQGRNGNIWSRPLSDWHRSMGLIVPVF